MPGITPTLSIYLDSGRPGATRCLLRQRESNDLAGTRLALAASDVYSLQAFWREFVSAETGGAVQWAAAAIDAVLTVESSLAAATPIEAATVAVFAAGVANEDGDIPYVGTLDLSGAAVSAAIGEAKSIMAVLDIRVTVGGKRHTFRVPVELFRAADGGPMTPAGSTAVVNHAAAQIRQNALGVFEFYDFGLEAWVQPVLRNGVMEYVEVP